MKCPTSDCDNDADIDPFFGVLACATCRLKQTRLSSPHKQVEFTSESIKAQRLQHADDIEPVHIKGELNKRWLDIYGTKAAKNNGFTDSEIKHAKYNNFDLETGNYYHKH